jgi:hypothetical protein
VAGLLCVFMACSPGPSLDIPPRGG